MRGLLRDNNMLLMAVSRFDIPFGFGDDTVDGVCARANVDTNTFLAVCNTISGYPAVDDGLSLRALTGYLRKAHTSFLDITLPRIRHRLIEAINYSDSDDVSFQLIRFYDDYVAEVRRHMDYENDTVFAYVDGLQEGRVDDSFSIARFSDNHSHMAARLDELKDIFIYHYSRRDNLLLSAVLFDIVTCGRDHETTGPEDDEITPDILGEREKEIIGCVARGLANKEIADELCLSIHTVATHRRNISAKLGIHSTAGLTIFAIIHHLVDPSTVKPR